MKTILFFLLLAALSLAATHNGDGTFKLYVNQSIESHTHYNIFLVSIAMHAASSGNLTLDNASYLIEDENGTTLASITLSVNESYNATYAGSITRINKSVLFTSLLELGFDNNTNGQLAPYAKTKVSSANFGTPPALNITSITIWPRVYDASVFWTTNDGANGTVFAYDSGSGALVNASYDSIPAENHSLRVNGLQPDSDYSIVIVGCDLNCTSSAPQSLHTLRSGSKTNQTNATNVSQATISGSPTVNSSPAADRTSQSYGGGNGFVMEVMGVLVLIVLAAFMFSTPKNP